MPLVAAVISQYFDFYHVGIFLNDEDQQFAWLIAANSEGGRRMLQRRHSLKIGSQGIVGYVAARGEFRVARNVGEDAEYFNNPDLPETKSEAALPLRRGAEIAGVLDVQSTKEDAFTDDDLRILAILADQVSLAMENTRLFETTRRSLMEAETLYRQYVQEAWSRLPQQDQVTGYRYTPRVHLPCSALSTLQHRMRWLPTLFRLPIRRWWCRSSFVGKPSATLPSKPAGPGAGPRIKSNSSGRSQSASPSRQRTHDYSMRPADERNASGW